MLSSLYKNKPLLTIQSNEPYAVAIKEKSSGQLTACTNWYQRKESGLAVGLWLLKL